MEGVQKEAIHLGWHFHWYMDWESVWTHEVGSAWGSAFEQSRLATVYHRPSFLRVWSETLGDGLLPLVGLCRHAAGHFVLLPWVLARHRGRLVGRRVAEYAGRELSGYQDPLVVALPDESLDWNGFWEAVSLATEGLCDQGRMRHVRSDLAPSWSQPAGEAAPVLDLNGVDDFEGLLARCSRNHRGDLRRRMRRLDEEGRVELHVASAVDASEVRADLRDSFRVHHSALCVEKGYADPFATPEAARFLETLFDAGLREGWAFYGRLQLSGETIAWILGLLHGDEFFWWRPAYHSAWKGFSPGKVLLAATLRYALSKGWSRVHFHAGVQRYKLAWKPELPPRRSVTWYPPGMRSSSLSWYDRLAGSR